MAVSTRRTVLPSATTFHNSSSFASASSAFSTRSTSFFHRKPASPSTTNLYGTSSSSSSSSSLSSVRFSLDNRPISPSRSISSPAVKKQLESPKRTCMCSPTSHPGSFRCSLHKNSVNNNRNNRYNESNVGTAAACPSNYRLNARRSAMTNSLVRIGTVEGGDLVRRALAALIRPSSHQQRRRISFQPRPSRLSVMSLDMLVSVADLT